MIWNPLEKSQKKYNICLFVDAAQMAPHIKIDVKKIGCDFLVIFWT